MTCSNYCHQGRQRCPTPYTCGLYSIDIDKPVHHDMPVQMQDEPHAYGKALFLAIVAVAIAGCVGLTLGVIAGLL